MNIQDLVDFIMKRGYEIFDEYAIGNHGYGIVFGNEEGDRISLQTWREKNGN